VVHGAVGVHHGVLHEAAVLVDLLLGDLRFRGRVSGRAILASRRRRRAVRASRRRRGSYSAVAAAAWRVVSIILKYPAVLLAASEAGFRSGRAIGGRVLIWTLVQHDVGLIDRLRRGREGALRAR